MSDARTKSLDQITEAEVLTFIQELRTDLDTDDASLTTANASLDAANARVAELELQLGAADAVINEQTEALKQDTARIAELEQTLAASPEEATQASAGSSATQITTTSVILHEANGNRLLKIASTDLASDGTFTVHATN